MDTDLGDDHPGMVTVVKVAIMKGVGTVIGMMTVLSIVTNHSGTIDR